MGKLISIALTAADVKVNEVNYGKEWGIREGISGEYDSVSYMIYLPESCGNQVVSISKYWYENNPQECIKMIASLVLNSVTGQEDKDNG